MVYSFELNQHANARYRDAVARLAQCELYAMLRSVSIEATIKKEELGGALFLSFESRALSDEELSFLSTHSSLCFLARREGELLVPLRFTRLAYLPQDLPEVLKYKGKTNSSFTAMMLNTALSLTSFHAGQLTVLDPLCGKATAPFCALCRGMNAVGIDLDAKDLKEASLYFERYLKLHMLKHSFRSVSETVGKQAVPCDVFTFADSKEHFTQGDTRTLKLYYGDSALSSGLLKRSKVHVILADLPYGVQHAPQFGQKPESFRSLLKRVLPEWKKILLPGGAIALSFNTLTLPTHDVAEALTQVGFSLCDAPPFRFLRHEVEQAVVRDIVFATNPEGGCTP